MSEFAGNVLGTGENPVVSASRGRFFVPNEDNGNEKPKKKRLISWVLGGILLVAAICFLVYLGMDTTKPPQFDELKELVGQPYDTAKLPAKEVEYAGVPLELSLLSTGELVSGFRYSRVTDIQQSANDLFSLAAALLERYGNSSDFNVSSLFEVNKDALVQTLNDQQPYNARWTWDLTEKETVNITALTETPDWPGNVAGYLIDPGRFYLDLSVSNDPSNGTASVEMVFQVEAGRGPSAAMDGEDITEEELVALFESAHNTDGAYTEMLAGSLTKAFNADPQLFLQIFGVQDAKLRQIVGMLLVHNQRVQPHNGYAVFQVKINELSKSQDPLISEPARQILQTIKEVETQFSK